MSSWGIELEQLSVIGALARDAASSPVDPAVHHAKRDRILAISAAEKYRRPRRGRAVVAFAFAAVLAAGIAIWLRPRALRYEVVGGSGLESPYVSAPPQSPVDLRFSDGSEVRADAGSRLRVDETYINGARVMLEEGATVSHVVH